MRILTVNYQEQVHKPVRCALRGAKLLHTILEGQGCEHNILVYTVRVG